MNRIDQMTGAGEKFFVAYYTAGFPTVEASGAILDTLVESGCDLIELGYPFSDPTADGPTTTRRIQEGFLFIDLANDMRLLQEGARVALSQIDA